MLGTTIGRAFALATAGLLIASPVQAKGLFGKLGKLADKIERKVDKADERVKQGERTKDTASSILQRIGAVPQPDTPAEEGTEVQPVNKVEQQGFIRRQVGRDVDPDANSGGTMPEPQSDPAMGSPEMMGSPDNMGIPPNL